MIQAVVASMEDLSGALTAPTCSLLCHRCSRAPHTSGFRPRVMRSRGPKTAGSTWSSNRSTWPACRMFWPCRLSCSDDPSVPCRMTYACTQVRQQVSVRGGKFQGHPHLCVIQRISVVHMLFSNHIKRWLAWASYLCLDMKNMLPGWSMMQPCQLLQRRLWRVPSLCRPGLFQCW